MLNPITYAVILGFIVNTLQIPLPELFKETVSQVGSVSTPLGMIYLGASLMFMKWGNMANLENSLGYVVCKMIIMPLCVYLVAKRFLPTEESVVLMLTAASPSTTIAVVISGQNQLDVDYAGELVSVSTLACVVTIPLLFLIVRG
jgi:hypothetical protein